MQENSWQGWQFGNRTFEDDVECDIEEILAILDENEAMALRGRMREL